MLEGTNDYQEDALNLIAKVPEIAATVINHHRNQKQPPPQPELGYMENFVHLLNIPEDDRASFTKVIKLFDIFSRNTFTSTPCWYNTYVHCSTFFNIAKTCLKN